ncbi:MAG: hypothetical protein EOP42_31015 [Sphingobacteriaceae bacterium]|nr:MAG: hypothetical protein EOP42_31015 [Sphingobacteriaceae bacterium]
MSQPISQSLQAKEETITRQEMISRLNTILLERRHAYSALTTKYTCFTEQNKAIEQITLLLAEASRADTDLQAAGLIMQTGKLYLFIAPRKTHKLFNTYYGKINQLLRACFEYKERPVKS